MLVLARPATAGVTAALSPAGQQVAPGAEFEVTLEITAGGSPFNAFDSRIAFDPAALTAVPLSPISSQIGPLFTSVCSNLFHRFSAGAAQDTAGCSMLCAGQSATGPGTFYRLRFLASDTPQQTWIAFDQLRFFQAGLFVLPVSTSPAGVGIGMPPPTTGVDAPSARSMSLRAGPCPASTHARFTFELPRADHVTLEVLDVQGRRVRRLLDETRAAGAGAVDWDTRDAAGARVRAGAYFAVMSSGGHELIRRIVVTD